MKIEFGSINESHFKTGSVFFLFGNFKRSFDVFCDFATEKVKNMLPGSDVIVNYVPISECSKIISNQCDLFGTTIHIFCIRNIEDSHLEKLTSLFKESSNNIFILESGDFRKSKSITDRFSKDSSIYALASFKNDLTIKSLCKLFLPKVPAKFYGDITKIINETDEGLVSLFKKMSLLFDSGNEKLLQEYVTYKTSFLQNMDFIPLARYLMKSAIKEKILDKKQPFAPINLSEKCIIGRLLRAEINQKIGVPLTKSVLDNRIAS